MSRQKWAGPYNFLTSQSISVSPRFSETSCLEKEGEGAGETVHWSRMRAFLAFIKTRDQPLAQVTNKQAL